MRAAVDTLVEHLRLPAAYHLGWCDADGNPASADAGKGLRGALAVLGSEAVLSESADAIPGAVAVELIHNFSLIHDDIMDNDRVRRHRRTVWDIFGVGDAIIVGDALHALAFQVLLGNAATPTTMQATARLNMATAAMIAGQSQDVALDRASTATLAECISMEANKTGALLAQSVAIGGVLGGGAVEQVEALEAYGAALGIAFQAVDDVLGIWGDSAQTGKPVGNDLREHKKSMPIAIALDRGGDLASLVVDAFVAAGHDDLADEQIAELTSALEEAGVRAEVESLATSHLDKAIAHLNAAELADPARAELTELARFVAAREG